MTAQLFCCSMVMPVIWLPVYWHIPAPKKSSSHSLCSIPRASFDHWICACLASLKCYTNENRRQRKWKDKS
jgi:hypothetical protein